MRVLLIGNCYTTIAHFRKEIITELIDKKYDVWLAFPNHSHREIETGEELSQELGCKFVELKLERRSKKFIDEVMLLCRMYKLISGIKPDCVLTFTVKPNIYGGMICRALKIPYIINVTGMGSAFNKQTSSNPLMLLYKRVADKASVVFFQNSDDKEFFFLYGYKKKNYEILPGSGVNLAKYSLIDYPNNGKLIFLYDSRVMREKGIEEFLFAADYFRDDNDKCFYICGDCEEGYREKLELMDTAGTIKYAGRVSDVIPYIELSSCVVLPSFYNEGISNCLLEAASCGRPIITTNHPGCRETVADNETGLLIEPHDKQGLVLAIQKFSALSADERNQMGTAGRRKMEKEFDRKKVVLSYLVAIDKICRK